jgi:hypothetical protein
LIVAGIDCSSFQIDVVTIALDGPETAISHEEFKLVGDNAFDRTRKVAEAVPGRARSWWDEIIAVGIEEPTGKFKPGSGFRVQGAVLAMIPSRILVQPFTPSEWRHKVGLKGNCSKQDVFDWVTETLGGRPRSQDAADAYGIALATRRRIEEDTDAR